MSIDRGMDKGDTVHSYNGILLSHEKEWNNVTCSNMYEPRDWHTEWSKPKKDKYRDITHIWSVKNGTNKPIYKTDIGHKDI